MEINGYYITEVERARIIKNALCQNAKLNWDKSKAVFEMPAEIFKAVYPDEYADIIARLQIEAEGK